MDARYDWLASDLQNSLELGGGGAWNPAAPGNAPSLLDFQSSSSSLLKNGLPPNHKGGGRADDLAAALKGLPLEAENGLVGFAASKDQMVAAGLAAGNLLKLGTWNGSDLKSAGVVVSAGSANAAAPKDVGWGHMPVRQDTVWDNTTAAAKFADPAAVVGAALSPDVPNDGTDIWRSALPSGADVAGRDKLGPWNDPPVRRISVPSDPRSQYVLPTASAPVHPSSWDGGKMWGAARSPLETSAPSLPDMLRHLSAARAASSSTSEADFGVWSHSSAAATVPTQQAPIDNGTAIWGSPPCLGETATTAAAARPPTTPSLPFSIDLTVPPPPLPKSVVCPPASAWNPAAHMVCFG